METKETRPIQMLVTPEDFADAVKTLFDRHPELLEKVGQIIVEKHAAANAAAVLADNVSGRGTDLSDEEKQAFVDRMLVWVRAKPKSPFKESKAERHLVIWYSFYLFRKKEQTDLRPFFHRRIHPDDYNDLDLVLEEACLKAADNSDCRRSLEKNGKAHADAFRASLDEHERRRWERLLAVLVGTKFLAAASLAEAARLTRKRVVEAKTLATGMACLGALAAAFAVFFCKDCGADKQSSNQRSTDASIGASRSHAQSTVQQDCDGDLSAKKAKYCLLTEARRLRREDYQASVAAYERASKIDFVPADESLPLTSQALRELTSLHVSKHDYSAALSSFRSYLQLAASAYYQLDCDILYLITRKVHPIRDTIDAWLDCNRKLNNKKGNLEDRIDWTPSVLIFGEDREAISDYSRAVVYYAQVIEQCRREDPKALGELIARWSSEDWSSLANGNNICSRTYDRTRQLLKTIESHGAATRARDILFIKHVNSHGTVELFAVALVALELTIDGCAADCYLRMDTMLNGEVYEKNATTVGSSGIKMISPEKGRLTVNVGFRRASDSGADSSVKRIWVGEICVTDKLEITTDLTKCP